MATAKQEALNQSLKEKLDAITFKNAQVQKIKAMQEGKERLKDRMGRNKARRVSAARRIKGLQTL